MRRDSVLDLARLSGSRNLHQLARDLFPLYRKRRISSTFETFVYEYFPRAAALDPKLESALKVSGKRSRDALRYSFENHPWRKWIPDECKLEPNDRQIEQSPAWEWGLLPVDFAAKTLLNAVRITQRLDEWLALRAAAADHVVTCQRVAASSNQNDWADPDRDAVCPCADRKNNSTGENRKLAEVWNESFMIAKRIKDKSLGEEKDWIKVASFLMQLCASDSADELAIHMSGGSPDGKWEHLFEHVQAGERRHACGDLAYSVANAFLLLRPIAIVVAIAAIRSKALDDLEQSQAWGLLHLIRFLFKDGGPLTARDLPRVVVSRLLQLEVIEHALNDRELLAEDAYIELVQISANSKSPIGPGTKAKATEKLLGLGMAHFAAFYKESWRANDWLYGRLDGSERLVKVLLAPDRLRRVFINSAEAISRVRCIAVDSVPSDRLRNVLETEWNGRYRAAVAQELAFLDRPRSAPPDELPNCAAAVTLRLHYGILHEELPNLVNAIVNDQAAGADVGGDSEACRRKLMSNVARDCRCASNCPFGPEQAKEVLERGLIGAERLADEAGSDLFTRTLAHTLATLQGTLASKRARLGPISGLFASLRVPVLGFYFVARGLTHQSRTNAALNGGMLATGAVIVAMQFLWSEPQLDIVTHPYREHAVVTLGWTLFAYGMLMSILRAPGSVCFLCATAAVATVAASLLFNQPALLAPVALLALIFLSVRYVWVQFAVGLTVVLGAGLRGSGKLGYIVSRLYWVHPTHESKAMTLFNPQWLPFLLSGVVVFAILLAIWQMTRLSKWVEGRMKRICRLK
jgi:hypothetical protein